MPTPTTGSPASFVDLNVDTKILALILGYKWGGPEDTAATVSVSFPDGASVWSELLIDYSRTDSRYDNPFATEYHGLNAGQQAAAHESLDAWGAVANITFDYVAESPSVVGDIRIAFTNGGGIDDNYAYAFGPVPGGDAYAGDVWLNSNQPVFTGNDFSSGANGYNTMIHELGHAIGMDHPFSNPDFPAQFDSFKYTVMSYSDAPGHHDAGDSSFYPTTPMLLDIQALQYLYGANTTWHTGNDTYVFNEGTNYYQTIWDAGGNDTIQYISALDGARIDLRAGNFSQLGNAIHLSVGTTQQDDVAIAFNVVIENATGGDGNDVLIGNSAANILLGGLGNDSLDGDAGNDTLDGGGGSDAMNGGAGNDSYFVDAAGDSASESITAVSTDQVLSMVSFTLGANIENLTLGGAGAINGTGNGQANLLTGNGNANTLDGGGGNDVMTGGDGNDSYFVDATGDSVVETSALGGIDTVFSRANFTLGANLEFLTLIGTAAVNGTGNGLANVLTGNGASNQLDGQAGADTLAGGAGDDIYVVDASDTLIEIAGQGIDTVRAGFSFSLADLFENLVLTGTGNFDATGNAADNALTGNSGNNVLDGGGGNDIMTGGAGNDTYFVIDTGDVVIEALGGGDDTVISSRNINLGGTAVGIENLTLLSGSDAISATGNAQDNALTGNSLDNVLFGDAGNDVLRGGQGYDLMIGGAGNDTYYVNRGDGAGIGKLAPFEDQVVEALNGGTDTVYSSMYVYTLDANVENLVLEGVGRKGFGNALNNAMTGDALNNTLDGGAGNDTLNGGTGLDRLTGGAGNDSFVFDNLGNVDRVLDYNVADDTIQLSLAVFAGIGTVGTFDTNTFVANSGGIAGDSDDRILYDTDTGALYYDADGVGAGGAVQFALLSGAPALLTSADFAVIA
jgi:serralysin